MPDDTPETHKFDSISVFGLTKKFIDLEIKETEAIKKLKDEKSKMIYMYGDRGNGKSIATQWYMVEKAKAGYSCLYIKMSKLLMGLYERDLPTKVEYIKNLIKVYDYIVIDEIDKISLTDYKEEMIFYLLDERIDANKNVIIVGNSPLNKLLDKLGENIISRIASGTVIHNTGELLR